MLPLPDNKVSVINQLGVKLVKPTIGVSRVVSAGCFFIGDLNTDASDEFEQKPKEMLGVVLKLWYLSGEVESMGATTTDSAIAIRTKNSFTDDGFITLVLFLINKAVRDELIMFRTFVAGGHVRVKIK